MAEKKKDPYEVEKKPPIISHIAGRSYRNRASFGPRPKPGGPIAGRSRKRLGVEPPSPIKPEHRNLSRGKPISMSCASVAHLANTEAKSEPPDHRVDTDTLPNEVVIRFDGDPRTHDYAVFIDKTGTQIGRTRRVTCNAEKFITVWEAIDGEWCEQFASRLVAAYELWQRFAKKP